MKIKSDFVTNSSSTSYLVYIPEKFDINNFTNLILESSDIDDYLEDDESKEEFLDRFKEEFNYLLASGSSYQYDNRFYYMLVDLFEKLELNVESWDTSSENGMIINVNSNEIKKSIEVIKSGGWGIKYGGWGQK